MQKRKVGVGRGGHWGGLFHHPRRLTNTRAVPVQFWLNGERSCNASGGPPHRWAGGDSMATLLTPARLVPYRGPDTCCEGFGTVMMQDSGHAKSPVNNLTQPGKNTPCQVFVWTPINHDVLNQHSHYIPQWRPPPVPEKYYHISAVLTLS